VGANRWRIGFTKFATRMLGEIVDHQWEKAAGDSVNSGEILGSVEGFKAISDLYCVGIGTFLEGNPALREDAGFINKDPYDKGWLYLIEGEPDSKCIGLEEYRMLLDSTIDRILEKQSYPQ
jgi:glycine cleavage system H protein